MIKKLKGAINDMAREREKKKKKREILKRRAQKFGQVKRQHSKRGMTSCMMGVLSLFFLALIFSAAYINREESGILLGFMGIGVLLMSVSGFRRAMEGFKERERDYITCKIGAGINGAFVVIMILIFIRGLF